jgi:hypothetical protein
MSPYLQWSRNKELSLREIKNLRQDQRRLVGGFFMVFFELISKKSIQSQVDIEIGQIYEPLNPIVDLCGTEIH